MKTLSSIVHEANAQLIEHGNTDVISDDFSSDYVAHASSTTRRGHASIRGFVGMLHGAFSDLSVEVEVLSEADERITWQRTIDGTQAGDFQGFPATGRRLSWHDMVVSQFADSLISEEWVVTDWAEALLRSRKP